MAVVAVVSILLFTLTGLDRFIPGFGLPSEPNAVLKKNSEDTVKGEVAMARK
jgi:hypothetical protein